MDYNVMDVIAEAENLQQQDETKSDQEDAMSRGVYEFPDGGRYVGEWKEDGPQGHGVCTLPMDGGHFQGRWDGGMQCSGLFTWPSGQKYIGSWSNGMRHGQGKEIRHDETYYLGDFKDNQRGVYGILSLANGALYRGQWSDGLQDGVGVEIYSDKGAYRGQYKKGKRHGHGTRSTVTYELDIKTNERKMSEQATIFKYNSTRRTTIEEVKRKTTVSEILDSNSQIYEGQWKYDKRDGHGVLKVSGHYTYLGEWSNNMRTGHGVIIYEDRQREEGYWENGRLVTPLKRKKLSMKYHQLENKVKQAHTMALQAADLARNKANLAESKATAANSRSKLATKSVETALADSERALEISQAIEPLKQTKVKTQLTQMSLASVTSTQLSVPSISAVSSCDDLRRLSPLMYRKVIPSDSDDDIDSCESVLDEDRISMRSEPAVLESKSSSNLLKSYTSNTTEDIIEEEPEEQKEHPMRKRSLSETMLIRRRGRVEMPYINKSTGEVTIIPDHFISGTEDEPSSSIQEHHHTLSSFSHLHHNPTQPLQAAPQQNLNMEVLNQMASWNKFFAYTNFILMIFLLLLIVVLVAFMSSNLSHNNPASFMSPHMA